MNIEISEKLYKEVENIQKAVPVLTEDAVVALALRIGLDAWKKDPAVLVSMLRIGAEPPKKPVRRRTPKKKPPEPTKVRSANAAGDGGYAGAPPEGPSDDDDLLGIGSTREDA